MNNISNNINILKDSIQHGKIENGVDALNFLATEKPTSWQKLILTNGILPSPNNPKALTELETFMDILIKLFKTNQFTIKHLDLEPLMDIIISLLILYDSNKKIAKTLSQHSVNNPQTCLNLLYQTGAYIEHQSQMMQHNMLAEATKMKGLVILDEHLKSIIPTAFNGPKASPSEAIENICEAYQVILAYSYNTIIKQNSPPKLAFRDLPRENNDLWSLANMASIWRSLQGLWDSVRLLGWKIEKNSLDGQEIYRFSAPDTKEFHIFATGMNRVSLKTMELSQHILKYCNENNFLTTIDEELNFIAKNMKSPILNEIWEGGMNVYNFRKLVDIHPELILSTIILEDYFYNVIVDKIKIGEENKSIKWNSFLKGCILLKMIGEVFKKSADQKNVSWQDINIYNRVHMFSKKRIIHIFKIALVTTEQEAENLINFFTFDPKLKELEIWDQPLIPYGKETLLFIPTLVSMGNPVRAIENITAQWNKTLFWKRGKALEKDLLLFFKNNTKIPAQGSVFIEDSQGKRIECDLMLFWQDCLILVEAKCTKMIFSERDIFRGKKNLNEAISQLKKRKFTALENWASIKENATDLNLPESVIDEDKIILIATLNVPHFTGLKIDDVYVTDADCLKRYFHADQDIHAILNGQSIGIVDKIRKNKDPNISDFLNYMNLPPQVSSIKQHIRKKYKYIPKFHEDDPVIAIQTWELEEAPSKAYLKNITKNKKKKRTKSRKKKKH